MDHADEVLQKVFAAYREAGKFWSQAKSAQSSNIGVSDAEGVHLRLILAVASVRGDHLDSGLGEFFIEPVGVMSIIPKPAITTLTRLDTLCGKRECPMANVLILGNKRMARNLLALALRSKHHVRQASTSEEACQIAEQRSIDLLLAEVKLHGSSGIECALRLIQLRPNIRVMFMSGLPFDTWDETDRENLSRMPQGSYVCLEDPPSMLHLSDAIDHLLAT